TDDALDGHDHDLPVDLAKLSLRTADEVKEIQAATFRTILVPADCHFVTLPLRLRIALGTKVMYARMQKTFDKKFMRFYFSAHPAMEGILDIVMAALTKVGGQEKYGTAPKSSLERDIQAKLDALT
ncbi:unnamed protein product, partial [Symbiodinium necroappetens]